MLNKTFIFDMLNIGFIFDLCYSNGQPTSKGLCDNGIPVGYWEFYHPNGTILSTGNYFGGRKVGYWIYRSELGSITIKYYL